MSNRRKRQTIAYLLALVSIAVATAIRFSLDEVLGEHLVFSVYYLAVTLAAWAGGLVPALVTAVVSSLIANFLFSAPQGSLRINNEEEFFALFLFLCVSTVIGTLSEISLRAIARAKLAEQQKDDFLAILAHELRNPLAVIFYANQVGRRSGSKSTQDRSELIERQVGQLNQMIDDLLDISRVTRGKFRLEFELIDASSIVDGALEKTHHHIQEREHVLTVHRSDQPLPVYADPLRLEQVVTNLLTNAAKYTPRQGNIEFELCREGEWAKIRVRDNGEGIRKEMLGRIFDLFTQVEQSLERSKSGLGIGLALVKTLVELHGGSVSAISDGPGTGSDFVVLLPLALEEKSGEEDSSAAGATKASATAARS